jgi:serine/threonine protein kinase/tetratricopeptide (TPR) repeat protein
LKSVTFRGDDPSAAHQAGGPGSGLEFVGPYRILRYLGAGGMGEVYLAEQTQPIQRQVALKIVRSGMAGREPLARFELERQALARMDHQNIARIFEAGWTGDGRPYFAMEYVPGTPITEYCDRLRLPLRRRIELFLQVCDGVQHAHRKAVIHRDLKPGNILVTETPEGPTAKVIDFGVAKALGERLTDLTLHTAVGQIIGTPRYMSPEQLDVTREDVDTRSDVYSLGVILYELLVGMPPFDELAGGRRQSLEELLRRIREQEPSPPSLRVSTGGPQCDRLAEFRGIPKLQLSRQLRGDLDWIVLKALEKDRERRYSSPGALAADLRRFLGGEPVEARPPSKIYRTRKFLRKHWAAALAVASVFLLLAGVAVVLRIQGLRIAEERDRANLEAESARQVTHFMVALFRNPDPAVSRGRLPDAREMLDRGASRIDSELAEQPLLKARLQHAMARAYENLGDYERAMALYQAALSVQQERLGPEHPDALRTGGDLAGLYWMLGDFAKAGPALRENHEARVRVFGPDSEEALDSLTNIANLELALGHYDQAEPLYRQALEARTRLHGPQHPDTLSTANNLASLYSIMGRHQEALELIRQVWESRRQVQGDDHPQTLGAASNLATQLAEAGQLQQARQLYEETLEARRRVLGEDHPDTLTSENNLGIFLMEQRLLGEAEGPLTRAVNGRRRVLGPDHPDTLTARYNLAQLWIARGRLDDAESNLEEVLQGWTRVLGPEHPHVQRAMGAIATLHYHRRDYRKAEEYFLKVLALRSRLATTDPALHSTLYNLACVTALQGRKQEAIGYLKRAADGGMKTDDILSDPDLAGLHNVPGFPDLVERMRSTR